MSLCRRSGVVVGAIAGVLVAVAACGGPASGPAGQVKLAVQWTGDLQLSRLDYRVRGGAFDRSGFADIVASQTASVLVGGIPAGGPYQVQLTATDAKNPAITCKGEASFRIVAGQVTAVNVALQCRLPRNTGSVLVNGRLNVCPVIDDLTVLPAEATVGGAVKLDARARDVDGQPLPLRETWSHDGGSLVHTGGNAVLTCTEVGTITVKFEVHDGDCGDTVSVPVTCSAPGSLPGRISCGDVSLQPGELCKTPVPIVYPFAPDMPHLWTEVAAPPDPATRRMRPEGLLATGVRRVPATIPVDGSRLSVELLATPQVSASVADYLVRRLTTVPFDPALHKDLLPFLRGKPELQSGEAEIALPVLFSKNDAPLVFVLPDGWIWARPWVIRWRASSGAPSPSAASDDVGSVSQALTGGWNTVRGVLNCQAPGEVAVPLPFVEVKVAGVTAQTDVDGVFSVTGSFSEVDELEIRYQGDVRTPLFGGEVVSRMTVMNDFHNPRSGRLDVATGTTTGMTLDVGTVTARSLDCELFELGTLALREFHALTGRSPPAGDFRIKRWEGVLWGTPYAYYDYVVVSLDFRSFSPTREARRATIFHEFGHTVRHAADGDMGHWGWDNFRWAYARTHNGREVFNEQYAFNEGWAQYWECTRSSAVDCPKLRDGMPDETFLDWNELRIGERLAGMAAEPGFNHLVMNDLLRDNRGEIHTFRDFEVRYCRAAVLGNMFCRGAAPLRTKASCPPGYIDDGATCRLDNILAKDSFGRGAGTIPAGCGPQVNDAGLCYATCPAGFSGVGPLCWEDCPSGYHDDGAFCRRDAHIITSDNSACDFWDRCGLTFDAGCSVCPAGFNNDGCFCRRDAHIFAKSTRGRGVGTIPTSCGPGREYDAGLCYEPCSRGFTGVGPVCWGRCPAGYADHGATCYREPSVLVKF